MLVNQMVPMRVVASLTTMPDRYHKIVDTLESINNQTYKLDAIYLGLPKSSKRLGIDYPPMTQRMEELCTRVYCEDRGPITKILSGLIQEEDPDTIIITFDDDMIYPPDLVERLLEHSKSFPDSAIGSSGMLLKYSCPMCAITPNENNFIYRVPKFQVPVEGRRVDSIYGYPGALYIRKFFPKKENIEELLKYSDINHDMFMNDDITISGYLSLKNIERRIFPNMPTVSFVTSATGERERNDNEISYDLGMFFKRMNSAISTSKNLGMYGDPEDLYITESILSIVIVTILSILILVGICVYILRSD